MKKDDLIQAVKIIALGLVIGIGISLVSAQVNPPQWDPPQVGATPSNATNTLPPINTGTTAQVKNGGLSVDAFLAAGPATFMLDVYLNDFSNTNTTTPAERALCVDSDGIVKLCGIASNPLNAVWGDVTLINTQTGGQAYMIKANITGGTPATNTNGNLVYGCNWTVPGGNQGTSFIPATGGQPAKCTVTIVNPTNGINISVVVNDYLNSNINTIHNTKTLNGSFNPGANNGAGGITLNP